MADDIPKPSAPRRAQSSGEHTWPPVRPPHDLGAIVHGPLVLAQAPDIAAGLRTVFAYPSGLHLLTTYRAVGQRAHDARSWSPGRIRRRPDPGETSFYSFPRLHVTVNDHAGPADTRNLSSMVRHGLATRSVSEPPVKVG